MIAPLYVSYFTPDYKSRAKVLIHSLDKLGLPHEVEPIEERGSWQRDSQYKARFVWEKMARHFDRAMGIGRPIVWVDADAEILQHPEAFEHVEADIMVCEFKHPGRDYTEMLSGTVYFRNNIRSHRVVDAWIEECSANPDMWDQKCLRRAVNRVEGSGLRIAWLPISYAYIYDTHKKLFPEIRPIIAHYQESRTARVRKP